MSKKLYFFGDSICVGQHVSVHKTWVYRISQELNKSFDLTVINASVNGNTTRMALERMYYDVLAHSPDFIYIQFGLNDCNYWITDKGCPRVSISAYLANLNEMVEKSKAAGAAKIFINTNHRSSLDDQIRSTSVSYEDSNATYYNALKRYAAESFKNIEFLDIRKHLDDKDLDPKEYLLSDGIHLNESGHSHYFEYLYPNIHKSILET